MSMLPIPQQDKKWKHFYHGLISSIGHPILGFDHLFFIIGVGILCLLAKKIFLGPMSFIIGILAGLFIIISGYNLLLVEFIIAISLLLIGVFIISGNKVNFSLSVLVYLQLDYFMAGRLEKLLLDKKMLTLMYCLFIYQAYQLLYGLFLLLKVLYIRIYIKFLI